jgi:CubicO group peptidase (beta-lactamase class C family)
MAAFLCRLGDLASGCIMKSSNCFKEMRVERMEIKKMWTRLKVSLIHKFAPGLLIMMLLLTVASCDSMESKTTDSSASGSESTVTESIKETTKKASETSVSLDTKDSLPSEAAELADKVESYMEKVEYHGVIFVAQNGEVVFEKAYGSSDHQTEEANRTDTIFELGSITKQFTAVAIMQLKEQGLLTLDDPLSLYVPEYPNAERITIRQLLNMTSGIPDYVTSGALGVGLDATSQLSFELLEQVSDILTSQYTHAQIIDLISEYELLFEPGTDYSYSNTDYYFLGMIIEAVSGISYFDYLEQNFFVPLGMQSTSTDPADLTSSGAIILQNGEIYLPSQDRTLSYAAGSICGTVEDLYLWETAVLNGEILTEESWTEVFAAGEYDYGFGWSIGPDCYYHGGETAGYNTLVMILPDTDTVIIALSNTQGPEMFYTNGRVKSAQIVFSIYDML